MPPVEYHNLSAPELTAWALKLEKDTVLSDKGALCVLSYEKTGRSPKDKRIVRTADVVDDVDWGNINIPLSEESFGKNKKIALDFLNTQSRLFVMDLFAGHDPRYQIKIRVYCTRAYHALFIRDMLIVPTPEQLANFGKPDFVVYNAGECPADPSVPGVGTKTCVALNFKTHEQVILGTQYAGEMKKGILTVMFYLMPKQGHLTMHASANEGKNGDVSVFFGLSGTGKTTLSADPQRALIGDDEHVWTDKGVFNVEGGCYAKAIALNPKTEWEIWNAVRFGAVAENCVLKPVTKELDFYDETICKNTRVAYPLTFIENSKWPAVGGHPKNVIFLTNDAFGVMPPLSKLSRGAAAFWFVTGYTASVAGVEVGTGNAPKPTFSSCFGAPFLVMHPTFYGKMLQVMMEKHNVNVWLVNTGYSGGAFGMGGKRMKLKITRGLLDMIHDGSLDKIKFEEYPGWGIQIPTQSTHPNVPVSVLNPKNTWQDKKAYVATLNKLAGMFAANFEKRFASKADDQMKAAVPQQIQLSNL